MLIIASFASFIIFLQTREVTCKVFIKEEPETNTFAPGILPLALVREVPFVRLVASASKTEQNIKLVVSWNINTIVEKLCLDNLII